VLPNIKPRTIAVFPDPAVYMTSADVTPALLDNLNVFAISFSLC
jgi:hypothetical protein